MPESLILQKNDIGINFIINVVKSDGVSPEDLSTCSGFTIYFTPPKLSTYSVVASLYTNGLDGKISYISTSSDLNVVGRWKIQASYISGGNIRYTSKDYFIVADNLVDET